MNFEELFDSNTTEPASAASRAAPPGEGAFRLQVNRPHPGKVAITVAGPLDLASTPRFVEVLRAHLSATTPTCILDLSGVTFLGTTAIEALLHANHHARTADKHLTLITRACARLTCLV